MDAVPGMVTGMWFTPTKAGNYEIACAEYCGVGHHTMRGKVVVEEESAFLAWLDTQPTFAQSMSQESAGDAGADPSAKGQKLAQSLGCVGCHTVDGNPAAGPTWKGLFGKTETLADGSTVVVDENYLKESITNPNAKVVKDFAPMMQPYDLSGEELDALVEYAKGLQ